MNKTVTATGMKVIAQTASTLLIDVADSTDGNGKLINGKDTQASTISDTANIAPTSTVDGENWFTATAAQATEKTAKTGTYEVVGSDAIAKYRLASTFYLQFYDATKTGASGQKLYIDSVSVSHAADSTNDKLSNSLRVMVVVDDAIMVCAPMTTTTPTDQGVSAVSSGVATMGDIEYTVVSSIASSKALLGENELIANMDYNEVYEANVYIFFDGEDTDCFTDNIPKTLEDYTVTVSFSVEEVA